jgi:hypothetical protein
MISMQRSQKMREDLSTAIDDHMSGNNASGFTYSSIFEENGKFAKASK